jgi:hypothetical protein
LSELIKTTNSNIGGSAQNSKVWSAEKDNEFANNAPPFLSTNNMYIQGETPYSFFIKTIRYALQNDKEFQITSSDIKLYFAINIIMTYIKYPSYRMYWSSVPGLRFDFIADTMSLTKYEDIKRHVHFVNNDDIPEDNKDSFINVRPVLDILSETFANACTPTEYMAIDGMIIPFKSRSRNKQYIKSKPKKWGFKVWLRASADGCV